MLLISHRGNISGANPVDENKPEYIMKALQMGYDVEVDVWLLVDGWFLGHDEPEHQISESFLLKSGLWCHAKNLDALEGLLALGVNCFWHESDKYTVTSNGFIWTYPGLPLVEKSICVMPENFAEKFVDLSRCYGICSDQVELYK